MTTRINVNVDQGGLLERSRQQTQSNRWGFLEEQNRKKVGLEAERQLEAKRRAEGKDANGNLYNNRLSPLPQRPDPAAWRLGFGSGILPHCFVSFTSVQVEEPLTRAGESSPGYSGLSTRLTLLSRNGERLIDPDFEKAMLVYPSRPAAWIDLIGSGFYAFLQYASTHAHAHVLPVDDSSAVLFICVFAAYADNYKQYPAYDSNPAGVSDYYTRSFEKCFLVTPTTVRQIDTPPLLTRNRNTYFSCTESSLYIDGPPYGAWNVVRPSLRSGAELAFSSHLREARLCSHGFEYLPRIRDCVPDDGQKYPSTGLCWGAAPISGMRASIQIQTTPVTNYSLFPGVGTSGAAGLYQNMASYATQWTSEPLATATELEHFNWRAQFAPAWVSRTTSYGLDEIPSAIGASPTVSNYQQYMYPVAQLASTSSLTVEGADLGGTQFQYPPKIRRGKLRLSNSTGIAPIVWSSLGNPNGCRQSLFDLGFTPADLTP